ncbi:MAG: ATP-binding cassette domain-containing protein [Actinophytocola sp.]|nr:ATP-binding cassette domain-containing protein [Actinophytocola sp.]
MPEEDAVVTPPLLRIEHASKRFPGVQALSDVGLELRHGEVLALVGENGAGKSTLMKLLTGIHEMDEGQIYLEGRPVTIDSPRTAQELGISVIHQEFNLMADLTVAQNIYIGREPRGGGFLLRERELNRRARRLFERLGITMDVRQEVGRLSVAKQQMVEIAKALSHDARVLIMDEPTAALNDAEVTALFRLIEGFRTDTTGVIYISHRMEELQRISDRVTVLRDGCYVDTRPTADTGTQEIISLMVGRTLAGQTHSEPRSVNRTEPVLQVEGLSTKALLRYITFDLYQGEILGFAGLMGAGRTELARALVGADPVDGGAVRVHGNQVKVRSPAEAARHGIGHLSEDRKRYGVLLEQDVITNILLPSLPHYSTRGVVRDKAGRARTQQLVRQLDIKTPSLRQPVKNLSGGNQQKIVIAKWLAKDCDIFIFDEPTRGIDVGAREEIYQLLNDLAAQGKSIIMISSELEEVLRMSHRIVVMCAGHITGVLDGTEADQELVMERATRFSA